MPKLEAIDEKGNFVQFYCPGCKCHHGVKVVKVERCGDPRNPPRPKPPERPVWEWNGSFDRPTLHPSLNYQGECHSWVQDGRITFLADSAHEMKNKSVELPEVG